MSCAITQLWLMIIATCALAGWFLAARPNASRGAGNTLSVLVVVTAVLMSILAVRGQHRPRTLPSAYAMAGPPSSATLPGR